MSEKTNIKSIKDLLFYDKTVESLTRNSLKLHEYSLIVQQNLPRTLAQFCRLIQYQNAVLTLEADSSAAATQLRFITTKLQSALRKHSQFKALNQIKIKLTQQPLKLDRAYSRSVKEISTHNRNLLRETAKSVADKNLASSLQNLAKTLENYGRD